ncbi:Inhibitor of growth protein 1 [Sciurus carolinensis]|uniref:Inhibitor of growth protein 1 n=1 Tax=Sciurus carolinensis TaxID=30640 RepID=A0AA41SVF2_SCICA|nr:Inhibitor of growth protein 1 [Sciurus carolinensis]
MLSSANKKQIHLVNYVEDYLASIDSLPLHLKRKDSVMQEIEAKCQEILKELDEHYEKLKKETVVPKNAECYTAFREP